MSGQRTVVAGPVGGAEDLVGEQPVRCRPVLAGWQLRVAEFLRQRHPVIGAEDQDLLDRASGKQRGWISRGRWVDLLTAARIPGGVGDCDALLPGDVGDRAYALHPWQAGQQLVQR